MTTTMRLWDAERNQAVGPGQTVSLWAASRASSHAGVLRHGDVCTIEAEDGRWLGLRAADMGGWVRDSPQPWRLWDAWTAEGRACPLGTPIWANQALWVSPEGQCNRVLAVDWSIQTWDPPAWSSKEQGRSPPMVVTFS